MTNPSTMIGVVLSTLIMCTAFMPGGHNACVHAVTETLDVQALMQFKNSLNPASIETSSCLSTWNFANDPCDSLHGAELFSCGLECQPDTHSGRQRVVSVKLDVAGYEGNLSPAIGALTALQVLQITGNSITGSIPSSIGQLTQLTLLDLSSNQLSGSLPESLGLLQSLQSLNLAHNILQGTLPASLESLISLMELRLQNNRLDGALPNLGYFSQLQTVDLSSNAFSGGLPEQFPSNVISVSLRSNQLSGGLTKKHVDALGSTRLNVLDVSDNKLSGSLDSSLFLHPSLQQLNLSHNEFTGISGSMASSSLVFASQLAAVDLSYNRISGKLPGLFASMKQLSSLSLSHNSFSGWIPVSYALKAVAARMGLEPLERLMLDGNYLTGPLPYLFMRLLPGSIVASLVDNCFWNCPANLFFCQGGHQKSETMCRLEGNSL